MVNKNFTFLNKTFADNLIYTHSKSEQQGKTDYLQGMRESKSKSMYDKIGVENINVRVYNDGQMATINSQIIT